MDDDNDDGDGWMDVGVGLAGGRTDGLDFVKAKARSQKQDRLVSGKFS